MAVADHGRHAINACQFRRGALRIAAGHQDPGVGVEPVGASDKGSRRAISLCRNTAGVDDHHIGGRWLRFGEPGGAKALSHRLTIGAGGAAAEIFDVKCRAHVSSLRFRRLPGEEGAKFISDILEFERF